MIKRQENTSSITPPASSLSEADHNGKDKYQRHGSIVGSIQWWMARNGKSMVILSTTLVLSVFLIPPLKLLTQLSTTTQQALQDVPPCPTSPWKPNENLQGKCPGDLKPYKDANTLSQCASSCCANEECISWQYRQDEGCIQGKDVRLGMEKDGVSAWCSDHPPYRWQGQFLYPHGDRSAEDQNDVRTGACDEQKWNPNEEIGQCFGLGDVKAHANRSAKECMSACCESEKCGAWQWNKELGCFYGKGMHSCGGKGDPVKFEPYVGRRKFLESRGYIDNRGKPWQMTMS